MSRSIYDVDFIVFVHYRAVFGIDRDPPFPLDVIAVQYGKLYGDANAVVGAQGGALRFQPLTINISLNRVVQEVKLNVYQLVTNHVHMAL